MWDEDRRLRPGLAPLASGGRTGVGSAMLLARSPPDPRPRPFRLGRSRGVSTLRLGRKPEPERGEAGAGRPVRTQTAERAGATRTRPVGLWPDRRGDAEGLSRKH